MERAGIEPTTLGLQDDPRTPLSYSRPAMKSISGFPPHPYSLRMIWCSWFSRQFSSSSWRFLDCRRVLRFRDRPIIFWFSSRGSGAGWSSTEPRGVRPDKEQEVREDSTHSIPDNTNVPINTAPEEIVRHTS
ncbi:hypothetical protein EYF80_015383 [Liparis tanakae]|uniref:Uncharacterized protein n=1 Tax=Liparis tanakae TaxID=230148 RepID=A0A4Z2IAU6_9TELE|nr:hypothetical protein EYF80_015383 [Liparis tanakae]